MKKNSMKVILATNDEVLLYDVSGKNARHKSTLDINDEKVAKAVKTGDSILLVLKSNTESINKKDTTVKNKDNVLKALKIKLNSSDTLLSSYAKINFKTTIAFYSLIIEDNEDSLNIKKIHNTVFANAKGKIRIISLSQLLFLMSLRSKDKNININILQLPDNSVIVSANLGEKFLFSRQIKKINNAKEEVENIAKTTIEYIRKNFEELSADFIANIFLIDNIDLDLENLRSMNVEVNYDRTFTGCSTQEDFYRILTEQSIEKLKKYSKIELSNQELEKRNSIKVVSFLSKIILSLIIAVSGLMFLNTTFLKIPSSIKTLSLKKEELLKLKNDYNSKLSDIKNKYIKSETEITKLYQNTDALTKKHEKIFQEASLILKTNIFEIKSYSFKNQRPAKITASGVLKNESGYAKDMDMNYKKLKDQITKKIKDSGFSYSFEISDFKKKDTQLPDFFEMQITVSVIEK